jgi:gamma-glutamylcyclotransferase (GGCT)/AIG2-like uncharacterized protein YtfP
MRLFVYGTLLDDPTIGPGVPAMLNGWRRVGLRGTRYPTLRRERRGSVAGAIIDVPAQVLARLAAYEGPAYRLRRLVVRTDSGKIAAFAWVAAGATRRSWSPRQRV